MAKKLKPVHNVRSVVPRCCATCRYLKIMNGYMACQRPDGPVFDTGDRGDLLTVCDMWRAGSGGVWEEE